MYYVGTSGWQYRNWKLYPDGTKSADLLNVYAKSFHTVEINSTFYHMPRVSTVEKWRDETPSDFRITLKLNRTITHLKKLKLDEETKQTLDTFIEAASALGDKLAQVLVQLPPGLHKDIERLREFFDAVGSRVPLAVEFRHESWFEDEVTNLLNEFDVAFVINDSPDRWPAAKIITGSRAYIRMHGRTKLYASSYTDTELRELATFITDSGAKTAYIYFNNTISDAAWQNAQTLQSML